MFVNNANDFALFVSGKFRPSNVYLLLAILLNPYLGHSVASVRLLAASTHNMDMTPALHCIGGEHGEDEVEKYHQFAHVAIN